MFKTEEMRDIIDNNSRKELGENADEIMTSIEPTIKVTIKWDYICNKNGEIVLNHGIIKGINDEKNKKIVEARLYRDHWIARDYDMMNGARNIQSSNDLRTKGIYDDKIYVGSLKSEFYSYNRFQTKEHFEKYNLPIIKMLLLIHFGIDIEWKED